MSLEPVEAKRWRNLVTGQTASIYGAVPWRNSVDRSHWQVESIGWTVYDSRHGTYGCGRVPWSTYEEAQAFCDKFN